MNTAAIYARVSSDKQEEQKTIESQVEALHAACKRAGATVVQEYLDDGVSGATLERPGLDELRDDARRKRFDKVYIFSPDRLARRYMYQSIVLDEMEKFGIEVNFLDKRVTNSPEDQLFLGMQGIIAEYERAQILERTRRGRMYRVHKGEIQGGPAPFGYRFIHRTVETPARYEVDEAQAAVVCLIFDLYLKTHSVNQIVRELENRGIRSPKGSSTWTRSGIHRMLLRTTYIGTTYYNKVCYDRKNRYDRPKDEWIPITVPPILDRETFDQVQRVLAIRKPSKRRRVYLLSRLLHCSWCGSRMCGTSPRHGRDAYYRCANDQKMFPKPRTCEAKFVRAERLEEAVLSSIVPLLTQTGVLADALVKMREGDRTSKSRSNLSTRAKQRVSEFEHEEQRLLDIYLDGTLAKNDYVRRKADISARKELLEKEASTDEGPANLMTRGELMARLDHFCALAQRRLNSSTPEEQRSFLIHTIERIVFDPSTNCATVYAIVPEDYGQNGRMLHGDDGGGAPAPRRNAHRLEVTAKIT